MQEARNDASTCCRNRNSDGSRCRSNARPWETRRARDYLRVFLSGAVDQEPDKQGRVLVPQMLRDYANLGSDIVVIGVGTRAEIWNRQAWEDYLADKEQGYSDIADDVLPAMEF